MSLKKVINIIIGIALIISLSGIVSAGSLNQGQTTGDLEVSLTVGQQYVISIPDAVTLPADGSENSPGEVNITSLTLIPTEKLQVKVKSTNGWYVVSEADRNDKIAYQMSCSGGYSITYDYEDELNAVLVTEATTQTYSSYVPTTLTFKRTGHVPEYGTYKDVLTFTAHITASAQQQQS